MVIFTLCYTFSSLSSYAFPLPGETKEGYKAFMCGYSHGDTSTYVYQDTMKRCMMSIDLWLSKLESCPGIVVMIDCKNSSFGHMTATPLDGCRKMVNYFQVSTAMIVSIFIFRTMLLLAGEGNQRYALMA